MVIKILLLIIFLCTVVVTAVQDFKSRLISLWVIILYFLICVAYILYEENVLALVNNAIGTIIYGGICLCGIYLYYFFKFGRVVQIIDSKLGWADVLIFIAIGLTMNIIQLVVFFMFGFSMAAIVGILRKKLSTVPLAGILAISHFCFLNLNCFYKII